MNVEDIVAKLRKLKPVIAARYKAKGIALFGSFVRGGENAHSDIDVLVEFDESADLLDRIGLALCLEETLQRRVDVVPERALRTELQESVLRQLVPI